MSLTTKLVLPLAFFLMVMVGCSNVIPENKENISKEKPSPNEIEQRPLSTGVISLQRQVELLQEAFASQSPKEAADKWASGVKARNGALQFAVLSSELKEKQLGKYEEMMWVTGTSSPWVNEFIISNEQKVSEAERKYDIQFDLASSTGPAGTYKVEVIVKRFSDKWYIAQITSPIGGLFPQ